MTRAILIKMVPPAMLRDGLLRESERLGIVGYLPVFNDATRARSYTASDANVIQWTADDGDEGERDQWW